MTWGKFRVVGTIAIVIAVLVLKSNRNRDQIDKMRSVSFVIAIIVSIILILTNNVLSNFLTPFLPSPQLVNT